MFQAVKDEDKDGEQEDFGGGVLHRRAKPSKHAREADVEADALQQVGHALSNMQSTGQNATLAYRWIASADVTASR